MKKILKILSSLTFLVVCISTLYFVFNFKMYIVVTGSMQPTFQIDELVIVRCSNENTSYEVGDIITYYDSTIGIDVTHRIVGIDNNEFYTQGDYNNARDLNPVTKEKIVGKVVWNSYFLGYLYVQYKFHLLILIIATIIAINIFFMDTDKKIIGKHRKEKVDL